MVSDNVSRCVAILTPSEKRHNQICFYPLSRRGRRHSSTGPSVKETRGLKGTYKVPQLVAASLESHAVFDGQWAGYAGTPLDGPWDTVTDPRVLVATQTFISTEGPLHRDVVQAAKDPVNDSKSPFREVQDCTTTPVLFVDDMFDVIQSETSTDNWKLWKPAVLKMQPYH